MSTTEMSLPPTNEQGLDISSTPREEMNLFPLDTFAYEFPGREISPQADVRGDDGPEEELIGKFAGLVAEPLLRHESAGPATEKFEHMQRVFRQTGGPMLRVGFVVPIGREGDCTHHRIDDRKDR